MMDEKQSQMWDVLAGLDGETAARLLTDWHGLQLLDGGFYGHLVDEGYIDQPGENEEPSNCDLGIYDCRECVLDGECDRQKELMKHDDFDEFCAQFPACKGCPLYDVAGDCEDEIWPKWKEGRPCRDTTT